MVTSLQESLLTPQAENLPTESFSSHTVLTCRVRVCVCSSPAILRQCLSVLPEKHRPLAQELVLCLKAAEVDGTHAVSRPTWSLGGWGGQGQGVGALLLADCVAAVNKKKTLPF